MHEKEQKKNPKKLFVFQGQKHWIILNSKHSQQIFPYLYIFSFRHSLILWVTYNIYFIYKIDYIRFPRTSFCLGG